MTWSVRTVLMVVALCLTDRHVLIVLMVRMCLLMKMVEREWKRRGGRRE